MSYSKKTHFIFQPNDNAPLYKTLLKLVVNHKEIFPQGKAMWEGGVCNTLSASSRRLQSKAIYLQNLAMPSAMNRPTKPRAICKLNYETASKICNEPLCKTHHLSNFWKMKSVLVKKVNN